MAVTLSGFEAGEQVLGEDVGSFGEAAGADDVGGAHLLSLFHESADLGQAGLIFIGEPTISDGREGLSGVLKVLVD